MFLLHLRKWFVLGKEPQYPRRPKVSITVQYSELSVELHYWHRTKVLLKSFFVVVWTVQSDYSTDKLCIHAVSVTKSLYQIQRKNDEKAESGGAENIFSNVFLERIKKWKLWAYQSFLQGERIRIAHKNQFFNLLGKSSHNSSLI